MKYINKNSGHEVDAFRFYADNMPDWFMTEVTKNNVILKNSDYKKYNIHEAYCEIKIDGEIEICRGGDYVYYDPEDGISILNELEFKVFYKDVDTYHKENTEKDEEEIKEPKIVTISGSTKFKDIMLKEERRLTLEGYIVLPLCVFDHADDENLTETQIDMLYQNHLKKIRMCDIMYVVDVDNYIGENTRKEIKYAKDIHKEIHYMNDKDSNMYMSNYGINNMSSKISWDKFSETGLILQINQILHIFGFAITISRDKQKNFIEAYPARVKFRGFEGKSVDNSYLKVSKYLKENADELLKDVKEN